MRLSVVSKLTLALVICVIYLTSGYDVYAVDPTPSPPPTTEADCEKIPEGLLRQNCISYADPQSGFPYHSCRVMRDPLTGVYTQLMDAGRTMISSMLPSIIADSPIFKSIFQNNIDSSRALSGTILNSIPNTIFELDPNRPIDMIKDYGLQYHAGCDPGNFCAQAYDLSAMGIVGDNLCIPEEKWGKYINLKIADLNNSGLRKVVGGGGLLQPIDEIVKRLREPFNSTRAALTLLCFRSTPNGDRILNAIVFGQFLSKGTLPVLTSSFNVITNPATILLYRQALIDLFVNDPNSAKYIETNTPAIINVVNGSLLGPIGDPFPSYKVQDAEMKNLSRCVAAAQDDKLYTALGNMPVDDLGNFISTVVFGVLFGIAGATTLLCVIYCAIMIQMSQGGESMGKARDTLMHCLMGLALIIFATFLLRFIGVDLLRLPGLS